MMGEPPVNEGNCLGPSESKGESLLPHERIVDSIKSLLVQSCLEKWEQEMKLGPPDCHPPWTGLIHSELIDRGFLINIWAGKLCSDRMTAPQIRHGFKFHPDCHSVISRRLFSLTPSVPHPHDRNWGGTTAPAYVFIREVSSLVQIPKNRTEKQKSISIQ